MKIKKIGIFLLGIILGWGVASISTIKTISHAKKDAKKYLTFMSWQRGKSAYQI